METLTLKDIILLYNEIIKKDYILVIEKAYKGYMGCYEEQLYFKGLLTTFICNLDLLVLSASVLRVAYDEAQNKVTITVDGEAFGDTF